MSQARENLKRIDQRVKVETTKAYRKMERSRMMLEVASEALKLQRENLRLNADMVRAGTATDVKHAEAVAELRRAEMDELQAILAYRLALVELERITGALGN